MTRIDGLWLGVQYSRSDRELRFQREFPLRNSREDGRSEDERATTEKLSWTDRKGQLCQLQVHVCSLSLNLMVDHRHRNPSKTVWEDVD
jgi:hypothetical protein